LQQLGFSAITSVKNVIPVPKKQSLLYQVCQGTQQRCGGQASEDILNKINIVLLCALFLGFVAEVSAKPKVILFRSMLEEANKKQTASEKNEDDKTANVELKSEKKLKAKMNTPLASGKYTVMPALEN
jgi:hypothetical protein